MIQVVRLALLRATKVKTPTAQMRIGGSFFVTEAIFSLRPFPCSSILLRLNRYHRWFQLQSQLNRRSHGK